MYIKYNGLLLILLILIITSCTTNSKKISNLEDYSVYLEQNENSSLENNQIELDFWSQKLKKSPNQFPYLSKIASSESQLFATTGKIDYLISAEANLKLANDKTNYNNVGYLRSLARNYISQHRFKEALKLLKKAEVNAESLNATHKMLFDVHLELGNYKEAFLYLTKIKDFSDFDYLIRFAKWSDYKGNLNNAITYLEMAKRIAESSKNKSSLQWIYSNLADFYGHDGQIKKSYNFYLKALKLNPNDAYSKKGIAWIVYSYERNPKEALRILNIITKQYSSPDYYLLKAEIADFMDNKVEKGKNIKTYLTMLENEKYGDMYNKYNVLLFVDEDNVENSIQIAKIEVENRPTPESYDLLAWSYYKKGAKEKALQIVEKYIANKTFEPEVKYHMAEIYKANGMGKIAMKIKKELLSGTFELGPIKERQILNL